MASPYDLTNLANVKSWLDLVGSDDDLLLSQLITQVSRAILSIVGRPSIIPAGYSETYDGGDERSIVLRQWPVNSVSICSVNGIEIPASPLADGEAARQAGFVLEPADVAPPGCMQRLLLRRSRFATGLQNVRISYRAGYQITGESVMTPMAAPYTVAVAAPYGDWASDGGVLYANDVALSRVAGNPAAGQYAVEGGVYTFSTSDAGAALNVTYGYVPADLAVCCMDWAAERYAYRSRIGQQSKSLGGQETMAFIVKDVPDFVRAALQPYCRLVTP